MNLNCETILDFYTHKNGKVLCQIKAGPKSGKFKNSCRFLSQEHWNTFDKELEKIITAVDNWNNEKCLEFSINPNILVRVQKSNLSLEDFCKCLDTIGDCESGYDQDFANVVLECEFDFQMEVVPFSVSTEHSLDPLDDMMSCSPLSYIPYTPSKKKYKAGDIGTVKYRKERSNSDNILLELNNENIKKKQTPKKDNLKRREKHSQYDVKVTKKRSKTLDEIPTELSFSMENPLSNEIDEKQCKKLEKKYTISSHKSEEKKNERNGSLKENNNLSQKEPKISSVEDELIVKKSKKAPKTSPVEGDSLTNSQTDIYKQKVTRREKNPKSSSKETIKILRRSERSPSKPKRFLEKQPELSIKTKSTKLKTSLKNKDIFGTDDDDDDVFENNSRNYNKSNEIKASIFDTPVCKKSDPCTSSSSTTKKKRKRDRSSECRQEKHGMSKWLSKKKLIPLPQEETKSSKTKSSSFKPLPLKNSTKTKSRKGDDESEKHAQSVTPPPITLELPSKEELELIRNKSKLMQKENARVRAELDKMCTSPPKEVEILSLQNIPVGDILETFSTYKSELDEIYDNNCKRDYIKGHDGINHCFVIRLLEQNIQMKMLEKLTEVYNNSKSTTQATLFANALLPEWVIRVYMEKFNFTRQQAIDQVKAQEEFQLHMEEQNDNTFLFD